MSHRRDVIAKMAEAMSWTLSIDAEEAAADALDALLGSDFVSLVREGVESGTIKGKQRRYCEAHDSMAITPGYRCDHFRLLRATNNEGSPCRMIETLVIPPSDGGSET